MSLIDKLLLRINFQEGKPVLHSTLSSIAQNIKIKKYLEVGVWNGGSFISVLENTKETLELATGIDNFNDMYGDVIYNNFDHVINKINRINYKEKVELLQASSHDILPELIKQKRKYDLILVDGDHTYLGQYFDIADCWELLDVEGIMIIDDVNNKDMPWVRYAYEEFFKIIDKKARQLFFISNYPGHVGFIRLKE